MANANVSVAAARWLVGVIAAVVLAFLGATIASNRLEHGIAKRANELVANAMPSVHLLTNVLGDMDRIDFTSDQYALASPQDRAPLREQILREARDMDALVGTYATLPAFPGEKPLSSAMVAQVHELDEQIARSLAGRENAELSALHRKLDTTEQAVRGIVEFDANQGQRLGLEIARIHGETAGMVVVLDALSVALAIFAAALAVRQLRRVVHGLELARSEGERREAALSAQAESLGQFAGRVAHDILSPLSTTLLSLELARPACAGDPAANRATERGISAINRVHTLVDGLLAFSRAGGQPEPGVSTAIAPIVADVLDELTLQAKQRQIVIEVAPVPDGKVACSSGVLTSVISNLVRNAIRYMGDATTRRIDVRVVDAGERWRFEVEDTGPGVATEEQARIFEPHVQLVRGEGIGLGLATVDRLVRAHGGTVGLSSRPGRGALFWFELPKPIEASAPQAALVPAAAT